MYRQGTNRTFFPVFFLPLFFLACCSNAQVLGIPQAEVKVLLEKGDVSFISSAELPADFPNAASALKQLIKIHPGAPFYAGLLSPSARKSLLFCAALESPSSTVKQEAIRKLIPMVLEAEEEARNVLTFLNSARPKLPTEALRAACLYKTGQYGETAKLLSAARKLPTSQESEVSEAGEWEIALALFAEWKGSVQKTETLKQKITTFLFEAGSMEILGWACREALSSGELLSNGELLSSGELAALSMKINSRNYRAILEKLPEALEDGGTIFFKYPDLIAILGRAFQYTPARQEEGAILFRSWLGSATEPEAFIKTLGPEILNACKFRIAFYSGRIERARGNYKRSTEYFWEARPLAPDALQSDSCVWYVLMNAISVNPPDAVSVVLDTIHMWNNVSYFDDVMDRLSSYLTGRRQWGLLLELFYALERQDNSGSSLAQYAWILGRAAQEGFFKTDRRGTESQITEADAEKFFRLAFEGDNGTYYHKTMAALKLGAAFTPDILFNNPADSQPGKPVKSTAAKSTAAKSRAAEDELEFILGFFKCGAAAFALPYVQEREEKLSVSELAKITEAFAASSRWKESLDLASRYSGRKDYEISRGDLFLLYPQPYKELIEKYAEEAGIGPELLYSLIRTESYFMNSIVSRSGAIGLAQIMVSTAVEMAGRISRRGGPDYRGNSGIDLENPEVNIHIGSYYLWYLTEQMGNPMAALLAYNGGMGRVRRAIAADRRQSDGGLPMDLFIETLEIHETREYGRKVLAAAAVYGYLYYGMSMEETAANIYSMDYSINYPVNSRR